MNYMSLIKEDVYLHSTFASIVEMEDLKEYVKEIAKLICEDGLTEYGLHCVLQKYGIKNIKDIKLEMLDLVLLYTSLVLDDHVITEIEKNNIGFLKLLFKIKEGDFYKYRKLQIAEIINKECERLYSDKLITNEESIYKFEIQDIFDLSYDQFQEFNIAHIIKCLLNGANILDLDASINPRKI